MNQLEKIDCSDLLKTAAIGYDSEVFQDIHLPSKNIAIYKRNIESLKIELPDITQKRVECRACGTMEEVVSTLKEYFSDQLTNCHSLLNDITNLTGLFEKTTRASSFRLLLATVNTDMCRKFHTDINHLRLLCTYIGPGTLWLPNEAVDFRVFQAKGNNDPEAGIDKQHIQQAQTGDVVILKGALYPDANPVLHRSPAIKESGEKRLLLRIDTNEFQGL